MIHFKRIGVRLIVAVGSVVVVGTIVLAKSYALRQEESVIREAEASLVKVADSVAEGLSAIMAGQHASVAPDFAARLKTVPNVVDFRVLRTDGTEAFVDNRTVDKVNERLGEFEYSGRKLSPPPHFVLAPEDPNLVQLRQTSERVFALRSMPGGERRITALSPIPSGKGCQRCHGADEKLRGAVMLTVSLQEADADVARTHERSVLVIAAALAGVIALIYLVAYRVVVSRIVSFSAAMQAAAKGDMTVRLQTKRQDEIGHMASSFNQMSNELLDIYGNLEEERNKLNTIIDGATSGIVVTDARQAVVLVNRAAERLLGKARETIVINGFLNLFDDREWMYARLRYSVNNSTAVLRNVGDGICSVQVSTLCDDEGEPLGSAALIRDVTEEQLLERQLKERSITDALTGLHNRRHFDDVMQTEFMRWRRYKQALAVLMIDVDHFKRFNDTHGHECGDRVLEAIGGVLRSIVRPTIIPCRYGGEEMVVILPGQTLATAMEVAETIRRKVADLIIDGLGVTVSIGAAACPTHEAEDAAALIKLADTALYVAKEGGRNQVRAA